MPEHPPSDSQCGPSGMSPLAVQATEQLPEQPKHESQQCHHASRGATEVALKSEGNTGVELMCKGPLQASRPSAPTSHGDGTLVKPLNLLQASISSSKEAGTDKGFVLGSAQVSREPSDRNAVSAPGRSQDASCQSMVLSELEKLQRMGLSGRQQAAPRWVPQSSDNVSADMLLAQKLQDEELRWHQIHSRANMAQPLKRKLKKETTLDAFLKKPALRKE